MFVAWLVVARLLFIVCCGLAWRSVFVVCCWSLCDAGCVLFAVRCVLLLVVCCLLFAWLQMFDCCLLCFVCFCCVIVCILSVFVLTFFLWSVFRCVFAVRCMVCLQWLFVAWWS